MEYAARRQTRLHFLSGAAATSFDKLAYIGIWAKYLRDAAFELHCINEGWLMDVELEILWVRRGSRVGAIACGSGGVSFLAQNDEC
jgi:hypothetical protein